MLPVWLFSSGPADHLIPPSEPADIPLLLRGYDAVSSPSSPAVSFSIPASP